MNEVENTNELKSIRIETLKKEIKVDESGKKTVIYTILPIISLLFFLLIFRPFSQNNISWNRNEEITTWIILSLSLLIMVYAYFKLDWITKSIHTIDNKLNALIEEKIFDS